jgi:hypothetical protein
MNHLMTSIVRVQPLRAWMTASTLHHIPPVKRRMFSCCLPFRQPLTSYKACVYGWQRQASSFKSSYRLPPMRSRDFCSLASHEPGFESQRLWCTDHQLGCLVWWLNPACSHERYTPKPLLSLHRKGQLTECSLGHRLYCCVSKPRTVRNRLKSAGLKHGV